MRNIVPILMLLALAAGCAAEETQPSLPMPAPAQVTPAPVAPETTPAPAVAVAPPTVIEIAPDTAIFRRTPLIDGQITPGEWDIFYSVSESPLGGVTAYADWDSSNLYIAVQSRNLQSMEVSLDLKDDGWYQGDDNYEIKIAGLAEGQEPVVHGRVYDSKAAKGDRLSGFSDVAISGVTVRTGGLADGRIAEVTIPVSILSLRPRDGAKLGLRIAATGQGGACVPSDDAGDVTSCKLVSSKTSGPDNLGVQMTIADTEVVVGQRLEVKLTFENRGKEDIPAQYFVIGGEGRAARLLDSERRIVEGGLKPDQRVRHTYRTLISGGLGLGAWAVGAELRKPDDSRIAAALASFEIVEPYVFSVKSADFRTSGPHGQLKAKPALVIRNNANWTIFGTVRISVPQGWEVSPRAGERQFSIEGENQSTAVPFELRAPANTPPGEYEITFEVLIGKDTHKVTHTLGVLEASAQEKPKPKPPTELP